MEPSPDIAGRHDRLREAIGLARERAELRRGRDWLRIGPVLTDLSRDLEALNGDPAAAVPDAYDRIEARLDAAMKALEEDQA